MGVIQLDKLTEKTVQERLYHSLMSTNDFICPNFTPNGWWECDMFHITKSGFIYEHEIKLTRSDFKADAKKCKEKFVRDDRGMLVMEDRPGGGKRYVCSKTTKHDLLSKGSEKGPSNFYFVVPEDMISVDEVPEWAGLKVIEKRNWGIQIMEVKKAPRLHKHKAGDGLIKQLGTNFYYRYWTKCNEVKHMKDIIKGLEKRLPKSERIENE